MCFTLWNIVQELSIAVTSALHAVKPVLKRPLKEQKSALLKMNYSGECAFEGLKGRLLKTWSLNTVGWTGLTILYCRPLCFCNYFVAAAVIYHPSPACPSDWCCTLILLLISQRPSVCDAALMQKTDWMVVEELIFEIRPLYISTQTVDCLYF